MQSHITYVSFGYHVCYYLIEYLQLMILGLYNCLLLLLYLIVDTDIIIIIIIIMLNCWHFQVYLLYYHNHNLVPTYHPNLQLNYLNIEFYNIHNKLFYSVL